MVRPFEILSRVRASTVGGCLLCLACTGATVPSPTARSHWAFQTPVRPELPQVQRSTWVQSPLDAFILARLEKEHLQPSPEASLITQLRRLALDLTGLPPTLADIDAFLADSSPTAYSRAVDRLLASPHYGERWGRHWLDAARYADSNGYEKDRAREMWHYRDWVIDSLNADLPYNQFLIEQIAGDLLPGATQSQIVGTGFLRNSMINEEGAIDPEQFRMEAMFDRMDCLGKAVLGLTIQCAQCHDHKYDPVSQEEYYRLFAYLNDADELTAPFYSPAELARRERVLREIATLEARLRTDHPDWPARMAAWEDTVRHNQTEWIQPELIEFGDPGGLSKLQKQKDGSLLAGGHRFSGGTWRIRARTTLTNVAAVRLEALVNANLPMHGPGRSDHGTFALREFTLEAAPLNQPTNRTRIVFTNATADYSPAQMPVGPIGKDQSANGPIGLAIDGNDKTAWTIDAGPGRRNVDHQAVFPAAQSFGFVGGTELTFQLQCHDEIGSLRLALTTASNAVADPLPRPVRALLSKPASQRTPAEQQRIFSYWRTTVPGFAAVNAAIEKQWADFPEASGTTLALNSRTLPRETALLKRGDWLKPDRTVAPGAPSFLHPAADSDEAPRLKFARWLADPRSPTTARTLVNRVWQAYFGVGLVATPEDLGLQSEKPSHPELLDWLACEFMDPRVQSTEAGEAPAKPWSLKHLHRLIVHSATYRQRSDVTPHLQELDPYNRLLARGPRFRVEGEVVRDIALAASGLLDGRVGGASVFAPAPAFLFAPPNSYGTFPWVDATGPDRYRRALYTFRRRSTPYPMLQTFDAPNGDAACVRRNRSNTPLQALTSLNEPVSVECAQALARRMVTEGGTDDATRLSHGFRRVLTRPPTAEELTELMALLARERRHIGDGWVNARELANAGAEPTPASAATSEPRPTPTQLAAYTVVARVLLNLDEALTKE